MNTNKLFSEFRKYGFESNNPYDKYVIEAIFLELERKPTLPLQDIENTMTKILVYMLSKSEKNYSQYLKYLISSKIVKKYPINVEQIKQRTINEINEMEELINELEQIKNKTTHTKELARS